MATSADEIVGLEIGLGITVQDKDVEGTYKYIIDISCRILDSLCSTHELSSTA